MNARTPERVRFSRPGGLAITDRAVALCSFSPGDAVLDVGCGMGESVRHLRDCLGLSALGVDSDEKAVAQALRAGRGGEFLAADAGALPFADASQEGVFFECSLSKMVDPDTALAEAFRVLRPRGRLVVSDFFARADRGARERETCFTGVLGRLDALGTWQLRVGAAGFELLHREDFTDALRETWGQLVFDYGLERILAEPGFDAEALSGVRCGYFLAVAQKGQVTVRP